MIEAAGRNHEHVCRTCKTVTGSTPSEYVNRIGIDDAAKLLRSTEQPIELIIENCGFENVSYFYRLFRQQLNTTPLGYRQQYMRDPFQETENDSDRSLAIPN
ncbi:MAG: AraC family transcriptional regulator [Pseudomonadota bacterium]